MNARAHAAAARPGAPSRSLALAAWALLGCAACGRALLIPLSDRHLGVYALYARAGRDWAAGRDLYADRDGLFIFRYSPLAAALLVPCGALPDLLGSLLWRLANFLVYAAGVRAFTRRPLPRGLGPRRPA